MRSFFNQKSNLTKSALGALGVNQGPDWCLVEHWGQIKTITILTGNKTNYSSMVEK